MNFLGSKTIETDRLILRATEESDLKLLWEILCIPEVHRYYLSCKMNFDWELEKKWQYKKLEHAKDNNIFVWSMIKKDTNECIGQVSAQEGNTDDLSIRDVGWFISPNEQRKGYTYEAVTAMIKYMFEEVEINGIETGAAIINEASWKLMEKLGFENTNKTSLFNYPYGGEQELYNYKFTKEMYKQHSEQYTKIRHY